MIGLIRKYDPALYLDLHVTDGHDQQFDVTISYNGWNSRYGLMHQRRLYLDLEAGDLRGEDRLTPTARAQGPDGRHFVPYTLRFQLHPGVSALVSQDQRSVLLRVEGEVGGWTLRNDTLAIEIEPSPRFDRPGQQLVLRGQRRADSGARVRWRLSPAHVPAARASATPVEQVAHLQI